MTHLGISKVMQYHKFTELYNCIPHTDDGSQYTGSTKVTLDICEQILMG